MAKPWVPARDATQELRAKELRDHRLVAAAFIGPCPEGDVIYHIDGQKQNNGAGNPEYLTRREHDRYAARLGLTVRGERRGESKLRNKQRAAILREHRAGISIARLSAVTGMSERQVGRIVRGGLYRAG